MHRLEFVVRDYECDIQGIVNNSVYQNYLEHARHTFLQKHNLDFFKITKQGVNLVLVSINLQYKKSLKPGDKFYVETTAERLSNLKFSFVQNIKLEDNSLILKANLIAVATKDGKPIKFSALDKLFI